MKRLILILCLSGGVAGAQAQLFSPEAIGGALMGTVIGGFAGGDCHDSFSGDGLMAGGEQQAFFERLDGFLAFAAGELGAVPATFREFRAAYLAPDLKPATRQA